MTEPDIGIRPTGSFDSAAEADMAIIEQLKNLRADLRQPREVSHYMLMSDEDVARKIASEYGKDWRTGIRQEPDGRWSTDSCCRGDIC